MADDRRLKVLSAIVTDYVRTREPVGSRALVERYRLGVSPATIRNDMAVLEDEGYIHQPHTSAGRVPTEKGYRLFVDQIARIKPLSAPERAAITTLLTGEADLEQVVARAVRVLARLTGQLAVVEYPSLRLTALRHLELVALGPTRVLLVIITDTGRVEQRTVVLSGEGADVVDPLALERQSENPADAAHNFDHAGAGLSQHGAFDGRKFGVQSRVDHGLHIVPGQSAGCGVTLGLHGGGCGWRRRSQLPGFHCPFILVTFTGVDPDPQTASGGAGFLRHGEAEKALVVRLSLQKFLAADRIEDIDLPVPDRAGCAENAFHQHVVSFHVGEDVDPVGHGRGLGRQGQKKSQQENAHLDLPVRKKKEVRGGPWPEKGRSAPS